MIYHKSDWTAEQMDVNFLNLDVAEVPELVDAYDSGSCDLYTF
jgi:hypothetical protein